MVQVYVAGQITTRAFTVEEADGIPLGRVIKFETRSEGGETVSIAGANASVLGVAYQGDFTGKYASVSTTGTGIGTARTQNTVANGDKLTVITKGCGAVVRCFTSATNISAGAVLGAANGGSVAQVDNDSSALLIGTAVTAQATQSDTIDVLLNY